MSADELTKRQVWVRSGGRCAICHTYLLEDYLEDGSAIRQIGEVAHVAGESEKGPRGSSAVLPKNRNDATNLILLCPNDHRGADKRRLEDPLFSEEFLQALKYDWESFIKTVTGIAPGDTTTVLRLAGTVKGAAGGASVTQAALAVMSHSRRMPQHLRALPGPPDIDLVPMPENAEGPDWAWGLSTINSAASRFRDSGVDHISVFAFAYVPLLVALGSVLDDNIAVDIYERHRATESWVWNESATPVPFAFAMPGDADPEHNEGVLIVNASGTVKTSELPSLLNALPIFTIAPADGTTPSTSTFESAETRALFDATVRSFFAEMEVRYKHIQRLHVIAAVPVSAAVTLGRRCAADTAAPALSLYHRTNDKYLHVLDVPTSTPTNHVQEARR
jgi:HPt (histidine-containing phosphotransfer) domain-containing protein